MSTVTRRTCSVAAGLAPMLLAAVAFAQPAPTFVYGKADDVKDVKGVEWTASAEAGVLLTTGSSETTTITGGARMTRKSGKNKFEAAVSGALARSTVRVANDIDGNGKIGAAELSNATLNTAETIEGKLRFDRFLTERNSLYLAALAKRDVPAGKEFAGGAQFGYSRVLKKTDKAEAVAEVGADYSYENLVAPGDPLSIFSARAFLGYKATLGESATVETSGEVLANVNELDTPTGTATFFEDLRLNLNAAISTKLGKDLSLSVGLQAKFDNVPAPLALAGVTFEDGYVPESSKLDTIFKASFIYTLF